jgi:hypothetical protein
MESTLKVIKQLVENDLIQDYAICGAMGAMFYTEPITTYDLDIFIILPESSRYSLIVTLSPIYEYLKDRGYTEHKEHIIIEGLPVQFLVAEHALEIEALQEARIMRVGSTEIKVLSPEYLLAIMTKVGGDKYRVRIAMLLKEYIDVDKDKLYDILYRFELISNWKRDTKDLKGVI